MAIPVLRALLIPGIASLFFLSCSRPSGDVRGGLLIVGGGRKPAEAVRKFVELCRGGPVLVISSASAVPGESGPEAVELFRSHGAEKVDWLFISDPRMGDADSVVEKIEAAGGIFFTGGVQTRLMERLGDSRAKQAIRDLYFRRGGMIGGTSAGAAVQSEIMITGDGDWTRLEKENIETAPGFGFLDNCILDQHFVKRQRNSRLLSLVIEKRITGIGIDESTAILYHPDDRFDVYGEGSVLVYDPCAARFPEDTGIGTLSAGNIRLSVLRAGQTFDMKKGVIL